MSGRKIESEKDRWLLAKIAAPSRGCARPPRPRAGRARAARDRARSSSAPVEHRGPPPVLVANPWPRDSTHYGRRTGRATMGRPTPIPSCPPRQSPSEDPSVSVMPGAEPTATTAVRWASSCATATREPAGTAPVGRAPGRGRLHVRLPRLPGHGTTWKQWPGTAGPTGTPPSTASSRPARDVPRGRRRRAVDGRAARDEARHRAGPRVAGLVWSTRSTPRHRLLPLLPLPAARRPEPARVVGDIKKPGVRELGYDRNPLQALHSQRRLWAEVVRDLPEVTQPVLLMHSREDHVVPRRARRCCCRGSRAGTSPRSGSRTPSTWLSSTTTLPSSTMSRCGSSSG